jgi:hypothetical protein
MIPIAEAETVNEVLDRLTQRGFTEDFRTRGDALITRRCPHAHAPEDLAVEEVYRFEGVSNPDEEAIIFALSCPDGVRGTFTVAYGPSMDAADAEIAQRLTVNRSASLASTRPAP